MAEQAPDRARPADLPATDWRAVVRDADRTSPSGGSAVSLAGLPKAPATAPPVAQVPNAGAAVPDLNQLVERWDALVTAMRGDR